MKAIRIASVLALVVMLVSGCDFFRAMVGKPTSEDMERMRIQKEKQARKEREQDSLAKVQQMLLEQQRAQALENSLSNTGRYHIVLGSFKVADNAQKMNEEIVRRGYTPRIITFNNGFEVVSVAHYDNYFKALKEMEKIQEWDICPEDIWIYDLQQNLHKQ